ncbi:MAG: hypothetical protein HC821_04270 [Lewinella sp.]|nr:hypothetical protein [Lewinella sp.]
MPTTDPNAASKIRYLIGEDRLSDALAALELALQQPGRSGQQEWKDTVVLLQNQLSVLEQQESEGLLSGSELQLGRSKLSKRLLLALGNIEKGRRPTLAGEGTKANTQYWIIGIGAALFLALGLWLGQGCGTKRSRQPHQGVLNRWSSQLLHTARPIQQENNSKHWFCPMRSLKESPLIFTVCCEVRLLPCWSSMG